MRTHVAATGDGRTPDKAKSHLPFPIPHPWLLSGKHLTPRFPRHRLQDALLPIYARPVVGGMMAT